LNSRLLQPSLARFRFLLYIAAAVGFTWPLALRIGSHLPLGTEGSATVPLFNLWTLMWNAGRLQDGYAGYWDAPIFYPETGTFALSEPQPLTGLVFAIFAWAVRNPLPAYNLMLLLFLTLNGISAEWLLRKLGVSGGPAFLAGLLALGLPFVGNELGVLQLTAVFPIFFAFGSLWSFSTNPHWRPALGIGVWSAAAFLVSSYYGLFLTVFLLVGSILLIRRSHFRVNVGLQLLAGVLAAGLLLLPVLPEQARLTAAYSRSETTIKNNSAELEEYSHLYRRTVGERWLPWVAEDDGRQRLFPGTVLLALAAAGLIAGRRGGAVRSWLLFALIGVAFAFILSFGLNLSIGEWQPYLLFKNYYPGFGQLRSPFRMALFVQVFLVTLAGVGLNSIWRRGLVGRIVAVCLVSAGLVEVTAWPVRLAAVPETAFDAPWITWLKSRPEEGALLMLPMSQDSSAAAFEPIVIGMLQGLKHGRSLGNGYSGFFPAGYRSLKGRMNHFPGEETIHFLQESGYRFLVIDRKWWTEEKGQALVRWEEVIEAVYEDDEKVIYRIQ
jgi:hypothetical protein